MYKIIAISDYGIEEIDSAETREEAIFLQREYKLAFGPEFNITVKFCPKLLDKEKRVKNGR